jgi:NhaA family Na+:H+ antiporter
MSSEKSFRPKVAKTRVKAKLLSPILEFAQNEATSGMMLVGLAVCAMLWANLGPAGHYEQFWNTPIAVKVGDFTEAHSLRYWINDGLMALFFLLMGLEIKREFLVGELSSRAKATLPIVAAIGGMVVPAGIYAAINFNGGNMRGTGVPMATDIAFSLGVLALLGSRVPIALKILLAAIAIVDDLGAVLVIALFYTAKIDVAMLGGMAACLAVLYGMNRLNVKSLAAYTVVGPPLWLFTLWSGVHATVAGVLLAMFLPIRTFIDPVEYVAETNSALEAFEDCPAAADPHEMTPDRQFAVREIGRLATDVQMPLERMEDILSPYITYVVVPVFALANAGVLLTGGAGLGGPVSIGVLAGLIIGKPLGILGASWLAVRAKVAGLPDGITMRHIAGVGILCGIGFTMSLFVAELAFKDPEAHNSAKLATIAASTFMGVVGFAFLWRKPSSPQPQTP